MQTAQINIKIDPKLKKQVEKMAEALGFSLSSLVKAYLMEFKRTKKVSFSLEEDKMTPFENKNDPFGDGITGKDIKKAMIKHYGYSEKKAKEHGDAYDGMLKDAMEGKLIKC